MTIMVKDILELEVFKSHNLLAGREGLTNLVDKVGIMDHETEDMIIGSYDQGEFVISTFFFIKDDLSKLYGYVEKLIEAKVSGLAIKDIYLTGIPAEVIDLADKNAFPIFIFNEVFYESIITSIVDMIKDKENLQNISLKVDHILSGNLNATAVKKLAYEINRYFQDLHLAVFCQMTNGIESKSEIQYRRRFKPYQKLNSLIPYNNGLLIIFSFNQLNKDNVESIVLRRLNDIGLHGRDLHIGVSSLYQKLDQLYFSISESLYACKQALAGHEGISFFNQSGTGRILIPVLDNLWVKKYCQEMITPLLEYDQKHDTSLLQTAINYVDNNGDIKATSQNMFQHSNTIRYRVNKINMILSQHNNIQDFYEELSIAIKLYKLLHSEL